MYKFVLAAAAVSATKVDDEQPEHEKVEQELLEIKEKSQIYLPHVLYSLGYAVRAGYSWTTLGEVKLKDVGMTFARTGYEFSRIGSAIERWGNAVASNWRSTLRRAYYKQYNGSRRSYGYSGSGYGYSGSYYGSGYSGYRGSYYPSYRSYRGSGYYGYSGSSYGNYRRSNYTSYRRYY